MAIKKSELYSSLWASCDELRGGMDASQYKDYVLVMLFIKYISDKYAGVPYAPITVPEGASFKDMVKLKGTPTIGDDINKKIIGKIAEANKSLGTIDVDFNNNEKLGNGKEMVTRLTNLIAIFENPALDFSKNKAEGDDILGDAYEYLMRHFATESGKSKGQFYTPAEVSRIMAKILGINRSNSRTDTTVYDPTCGSGSLLLKVAAETEKDITIYGQEKDVSTAALARMNMVLHNSPTAVIRCNGNSTLADPLFKDGDSMKTFDYVVANPPFSYASWTTGVNTADDKPNNRFKDYGIPPEKNGDYAFLLHIVRSLKSKGKGAIILPHGVLFRGGAEGEIRRNLIRRGYIKGIIGLPANLFYGTGIPACLIVIDKEHADSRKSIFMIDASKSYVKDGNKNRLREQDIHKITDVFNKRTELAQYSRIVPLAEIEQKEYNLNIPRYIDSQEAEDMQDIAAHLNGGIPNTDIEALHAYWEVYPGLKEVLFAPERPGYSRLLVAKDDIKVTIFHHREFINYGNKVKAVFDKWQRKNVPLCKAIDQHTKPKRFIADLSEDLLESFSSLHLIDAYDVYQHLMTYWNETMQDDVYVIVSEGWKAGNEVRRLHKVTKDKEGKITKVKEIEGIGGLESKLIPPSLLVRKYHEGHDQAMEKLEAERELLKAQMEEIEEEHGGEDGLIADARTDKGEFTHISIRERLKAIKKDKSAAEERKVLEKWIQLYDERTEKKRIITAMEGAVELLVKDRYHQLTIAEIKALVVEDKWMHTLSDAVDAEMQRISQRLTQRIKELAERYETTMPALLSEVEDLESKVNAHLQKMGFSWN